MISPVSSTYARSAIANARNSPAEMDVDQLVVKEAYVHDGPRMKRILVYSHDTFGLGKNTPIATGNGLADEIISAEVRPASPWSAETTTTGRSAALPLMMPATWAMAWPEGPGVPLPVSNNVRGPMGETATAVLSQAVLKPDIIAAITRPAEAKPWKDYRKIFLTPERIKLVERHLYPKTINEILERGSVL